MMKAVVVLLCFTALISTCYGLGNGSGKGSPYFGRSAYKSDGQRPVYNGLGYANGDYQMKQASAAKPVESKPSRGIGLSAWGIIAVMAGGVFFCTAAYYAVLFYPILCKKERKYDIMELNSV
ncbi:uncharacterized protein LOC128990331 isoform X2 [Macrosteles quadrilineatus]|uniref:uncharacterized protein LOC128990331 isoform X2 n=1 Tax=Macrosteles quadrilineatus TaxID=74068 RepID=UPI0023E2E33A|nr:uncharacterized protein LOC128990331 isoform X2 [Macrosteles quadrilineatus]